jgi:putative DNA primase/helicase
LGRKPVQVEKQIKDEKGNVTGTKTVNSYRNEWAVKAEAIRDSSRDAKELVKEHPDLINEITAVKLAGEPAEFGKNRTLRFSGHP